MLYVIEQVFGLLLCPKQANVTDNLESFWEEGGLKDISLFLS